MTDGLPDLYFRIRENGALVFRIDAENRHRRLDLEQVAVVNARNGEIKPQGERRLTADEIAQIRRWLAERQGLLARREADEMARVVERINLAAQWAQARATDAELEELTDPLLLAIHDLRTVLVRRKVERLQAANPGAAEDD